MRAVVCQHGRLEVTEVPTPVPDTGQVLLQVTGCGICGSDLHARHHGDAQADILAEAGYDGFMRSTEPVVLGHEFSGRVTDYGPHTTKKVPTGTPVVALPLVKRNGGMHPIGLSASAPGGYAETVVVQEAFMMPVPNGLNPVVAALTEPLAIGHHAVRRAQITKRDTAVVIGCGPVGLAVIVMLKAEGVDTVVASDPSPLRRQLAADCGATTVVDPTDSSPFDALADKRYPTSIADTAAAGLAGLTQLQRLPVPWHLSLRALDTLGFTAPKRPVIFECVGTPGMIDTIITAAPLASRVVVVGVCMEPDHIRPVMAVNKEIDLRFVVGYSPLEFRHTLHLLADGKIDATKIHTATIGLHDVPAAFDTLAHPGSQAKMLIDPTR
jgi:threonine dehydrogenase-like Zn-dependent dehydrogenase